MAETKRLPAVVVPADALDDFAKQAVKCEVTVSHAIREALSEYAFAHWGVHLDFSVGQWGGKHSK